MKITKRKTKSGMTVTVTAETKDDKKRLMESILSGELMRALNAAGQLPTSIEFLPKGKTR